MSKTLLIDNRIFNDSWFYSLTPDSKLLFLFLLLNDVSNIIGCYEIPLQIIISYTGLTDKRLKVCFDELKSKVIYQKGWVIVKNYCKYNPMRNPSIEVAQKKLEKTLPEEIYTLYTACTQGVDTLYTGSKEQEQDININNNIGVVGDQRLATIEKDPLAVIDEEYMERLATEFKVTIPFVRSVLDDLNTYINGYRGKKNKYTDFKLVLRNWVKKEALKVAGVGKIDPYKRGIDATGLS